MRDIFKLGTILMLYTLAAGALLVFVHTRTEPLIQANKDAAMSGEVLAQLLPGMDGGFEKKGTDTEFPYWVGYRDAGKTTPGGYLFVAYGKGYSSTLETLVGVDTGLTITGALVLFQQETPGLGDRVLEINPGEDTPWFTNQFVGTSADDNLKVTKDGGVIDAISGATVSSRAVTASIASALANMAAVLSGGEIVVEEIVAEEDTSDPFIMPADSDLGEVLPGMDSFEVTGGGTTFPFWTGMDGGSPGGYAFVARGAGFASTIHTLVATDSDGVITGIKTLSQDETPGYGTQMLDINNGDDSPWFTAQFIGLSADDGIALAGDGGAIDALTGATITSNAVAASIAEGLVNLTDARNGKTFPAWTGEITVAEAPGGNDEDGPDDLMARLMAGRGEEEKPAASGPTDEQLAAVLPGMTGFERMTKGDITYWAGYTVSSHEVLGGYAFIAEGDGFASTIKTLAGVDTEGTILGALVISQEETPGYGTLVVEVKNGEEAPWFTRQYIGLNAADTIALTSDGGTIDAITGATISSRAVTESINDTIKSVMTAITGKSYGAAKPADEPDDRMARLMAEREAEETPAEEPADRMAQLMGNRGGDAGDDFEDASDEQDFASVLPGMNAFKRMAEDEFTYWIGYTDAAHQTVGGYAFVAAGRGFSSTIETLVGVDPGGTITGARVLSQKETPGYGDQVQEVKDGEDAPWFTRQYTGLSSADEIAFGDDGGKVDAITGATISSRAVTESIAAGYASLMSLIR